MPFLYLKLFNATEMLIQMKGKVSQWHLSCAYTIIPRHSFWKESALSFKTTWNFLKRKAIAYSAYPRDASAVFYYFKRPKRQAGVDGVWVPAGLQGPGRGFSWHSPSICQQQLALDCPHAAYSRPIVKFRDLAQRRYLVVNRWHA